MSAPKHHELFPEFDKCDKIVRIYVGRKLPDGREATYPRTFTPTELDSLQKLYELVGGGTYMLRARDDSTPGWFTSERHDFEGPPRPFVHGAGAPDPAPLAPAVPPSESLAEKLLLAIVPGLVAQRAPAPPPDNGLQMEILRMMKDFALAGNGSEQFIKGMETAAELRAGLADALPTPAPAAPSTAENVLTGVRSALQEVKELGRMRQGNAPAAADPYGAAVTEARRSLGPAAAELSDGEALARWGELRAGRSPAA